MKQVTRLLSYCGVGIWLVLASLLLTGCQSQQQFTDLPGVGGASSGAPAAGVTTGGSTVGADNSATTEPGSTRDRILVGNTIVVTFSDTPTPMMPLECRVRDDGKITALQNQDFVAAGKTLGQLAKELHDFYVPNFYPNLTVTVSFKADTQFYYVGGEVKAPGRQVYLGPVHLLGAIKSAGDFTDFGNKRSVRVTRSNGRTFNVDCKKALKNPALDPEIFPGDNINVPRRYNPFSF